MSPTISVILPVYNAEAYISDCIQCILEQSFENYELLIVNDGSIDKSEEIILSHDDKRIRYIENKNNQGLIKSLNKALYIARGEYIARMDADDLCDYNRFEKQLDFFNQDSEVDILGTYQHVIGSQTIIPHHLTNDENKIQLLLEPAVGHSCVMIRKKSLLQNKLYYDKNALYAEDYKLWIDSSLCGLSIKNMDECLCGYRIHPDQISNKQQHIQKIVTNQIRLEYAKYFFKKIIDGNEKEYLLFLLGCSFPANSYLIEKIEYIYNQLLNENNHKKYFNQNLFENFLWKRFLYLKNSIE